MVTKEAGTITPIEFENGEFFVDAAVIAQGLGLEPKAVQSRMREGHMTSLCERGMGEDKGRYRLTFFAENRRFRAFQVLTEAYPAFAK